MFVLALLVHAVMLTQGLYWYQAVELLCPILGTGAFLYGGNGMWS